jgi:hypothetical protein
MQKLIILHNLKCAECLCIQVILTTLTVVKCQQMELQTFYLLDNRFLSVQKFCGNFQVFIFHIF